MWLVHEVADTVSFSLALEVVLESRESGEVSHACSFLDLHSLTVWGLARALTYALNMGHLGSDSTAWQVVGLIRAMLSLAHSPLT